MSKFFGTKKKYKVIYADPPWSFDVYSDKGKDRSAEQHYKTMTLDDIKTMPVHEIADKDCVLLMWVTMPNLVQGIETIEAWGFTYKTCGFTWVKRNKHLRGFFMGLGYWTRCLGADHTVYVQHRKTSRIQRMTLRELHACYREYRIWSPNGWKEIYDSVKTEGEAVQLETSGRTLLCSKNHIWPVKVPYRPRVNKDENKRTRLSKIIEVPTEKLIQRWSSSTQKSASTNLLFSTAPMESDSPIEYIEGLPLDYDTGWLLGLFIAEGHYIHGPNGNSNNLFFSLHKKETYLVNRVNAILSKLSLKNERYPSKTVVMTTGEVKGKEGRWARFSSKKIKTFFQYWVQGETAQTKRLNLSEMYNTPIQFRLGALEGMLAGDGTKSPHGYKQYRKMKLCNKGLVHDFMVLSESLGVLASTDGKPYVSKSKICKDSVNYKLSFYSYRGGTNEDLFKNQPMRTVGYSEKSKQVLYDLSVEDSLFVVDGVITHNSNPELCLLATRGNPKRKNADVQQLLISPIREHSRKPDEMYPAIERLLDGPYIELFSRTKRKNWDAWGNEVGKFS